MLPPDNAAQHFVKMFRFIHQMLRCTFYSRRLGTKRVVPRESQMTKRDRERASTHGATSEFPTTGPASSTCCASREKGGSHNPQLLR